MQSFFWHDYETWGIDPAIDRPAQFAAIRTDMDLNVVGDPIMHYIKPPLDTLIQPEACLVTGITPQLANQQGITEVEFIRTVRKEMMQPGTCSVGYNSLRFDDEVTRNTLYRNFFDPYEREYKNGNARWDIIDVVRLCYALKPEGFVWPKDEVGNVTFRLEKLTEANEIEQLGAHDALVDVKATIALAQKIKQLQPQLFAYCLAMSNKHLAKKRIKLGSFTPFFHVSSMFSNQQHCCSVVLPIALHPTNQNEIICIDLKVDPKPFFSMTFESLLERQFASKEALLVMDPAESPIRPPIKNIHLNKSPIFVPVSMLKPDICDRLSLDSEMILQHRQQWLDEPAQREKIENLFKVERKFPQMSDPDRMLYSGGFFSQQDKKKFTEIHKLCPEDLQAKSWHFQDERLDTMLFRYRARNYPESLTDKERMLWLNFCQQRILSAEAGGSIDLSEYNTVIEDKLKMPALSSHQRRILLALKDWQKIITH